VTEQKTEKIDSQKLEGIPDLEDKIESSTEED